MHNDLEMNLRSDALLRFESARRAVLSETVTGEGIGTLSEKSLHKILKSSLRRVQGELLGFFPFPKNYLFVYRGRLF